LEDPRGDIFATVRPEKTETDAMKGFVDTHVASGGRGMVGRKDITAERYRNND
jgi:hypothetical protein